MTNEERVRQEIISTQALAEYLIVYNDDWGMYYTSDGNGFYWRDDAIRYEIKWLQSESET
jgi:hypothetical protein